MVERVCMRVVATLLASGQTKMGVRKSWKTRVCMRVVSTFVASAWWKENESWWELVDRSLYESSFDFKYFWSNITIIMLSVAKRQRLLSLFDRRSPFISLLWEWCPWVGLDVSHLYAPERPNMAVDEEVNNTEEPDHVEVGEETPLMRPRRERRTPVWMKDYRKAWDLIEQHPQFKGGIELSG